MEKDTVGSAATIEAVERGAAEEQHLWQAVIASTIQDWLHAPLRMQREAEQYLFHDEADFPEVCQSAGMDAGRLRARLRRLHPQSQQPEGVHKLAA